MARMEMKELHLQHQVERMLTRFTWSRGDGDTNLDPVTQSRFERAQERLYRCFTDEIVNGALNEELKSHSFVWFQHYIDARAAAVWKELVVRALYGLDEQSKVCDIESKIKLYDLVGHVANIITQDPDSALTDIIGELELISKKEKTFNRPPLLREDTDMTCVYLTFQVLGWITALCDPMLGTQLEYLTVADDGSKSRRRTLLHIPTVRHLKVKVDVQNRPVYEMLDRFGDLLPKPDSLINENDMGRFDVESAYITSAYVSFYHLENTLKVKLRWTNTLGQHLEYDRRQNVLHVFAAPSICSLILHSGGRTPLVAILEQFRDHRKQANVSYKEADFRVYLSEILLSYRLIFGSDKSSRKRIQPLLAVKEGDGRYGNKCDPLLHTLCSGGDACQETKTLFSELGIDRLSNYVPLEEFQFLGKRLVRLESISKGQNPSNWRKFWNDKRNPKEWFATWVVIFLGGGTLFLQAMQLVFQIWAPPIGGNAPGS